MGVTDRTVPSRTRIRDAAAELFARDGFAATGVREIAALAGVAPALVIRHFGSKEALFLDAVTMADPLGPPLQGPLETLGHDLVAALLAARDPADGGIFASLMRASDRPAVRAILRASGEASVVGPLRVRLTGPDPELRARLVSACVLGLLGALDLLEDDAVRAAAPQTLAELYGAAIQRLVDGPPG